MAARRQGFAVFLILLAVGYGALAIYFVSLRAYEPALGAALTSAVAVVVARSIRSMEAGGPSIRLAVAFVVLIAAVNLVLWRAVL